MEQLDAVLVLTTWPAADDPSRLASALVEERLAACVNLLPEMTSVYRWHDHVDVERERQLVIKTTRPRLEALPARVRSLHPYEVPEWLVLPVIGGGEDYLAWLGACTAAPGRDASRT
jgi:periplasmic divalent cation tolerance protein